MIVVTGGAGFIGSALIWKLNTMGHTDILAVDHLGTSDKWKNLAAVHFSEYLEKGVFISKLERGDFGDDITVIFHLGACSSTTETDAEYLMENNFRYSVRIGRWREGHRSARLIYASSAATYGAGERGYSDNEAALRTLRPMNMYGYSKHLFDLYALRKGWLKQCAGLKYFNVFGPNEYHKGDMRSVINKAFPGVRDEGKMRLFKSYRDSYADGDQARDFIYIKDALEMTVFFMENPSVAGLYNIGSGEARTWNDVARAMFAAAGRPLCIEYIEMPEALRGAYQYFTRADLGKLRAAGCAHRCMSLEEAVGEYVRGYLMSGARLGHETAMSGQKE
jgi:ADP-L-glycero-D-manno-heptose 6-epimerase